MANDKGIYDKARIDAHHLAGEIAVAIIKLYA
jgi:hypothetical protein